jgi:hypothetical protein
MTKKFNVSSEAAEEEKLGRKTQCQSFSSIITGITILSGKFCKILFKWLERVDST